MSTISGGIPLFTPRSGGSGGGGGGSALLWSEQANSPILDVENNFEVYLFASGLTQELYTALRVPSSYSAGNPIKLLVEAYSPDTSGTILLRAQSTLIRAEVDEMSSTTNQRTTTNSAITMTANNDNEPQKIELDIASSSGQINAVAIAAGDLIKVRLYRDTDTATSDVRFIKLSGEPTFS